MIFHDEELSNNDFFEALEKLLDPKDVKLMGLEYQNDWEKSPTKINYIQKRIQSKLFTNTSNFIVHIARKELAKKSKLVNLP